MNKIEFYIADCVKNGGIYKYSFDGKRAEFISKKEMDFPMYMAKAGERLYIPLRYMEGSKESGVISFKITGSELTEPSAVQSTHGECACHIAVDNGNIYCANYISGSVCKLPDTLIVHEGHGPNTPRQDKAHTHFVMKTFDGYILAVDLGMDTVFTYTTDLEEVSKSKIPDGHGARHLVFSKDNRYVYCINELAATVTVFSYNDGRLTPKGTYRSLPEDFHGANTAAAIRISGDGKYLYVSNRGHDSITAFEIDGEELILKSITPCGGKGPRDFNIIGDFLICTNEGTGNVTIFSVDKEKLAFIEEIDGFGGPLCVIEA